jgi:deferrochelatase/peroxidase EfeB
MSPLDRRQFVSRSLALLGAGGVGALAGAGAEAHGGSHLQQPPTGSALQTDATRATLDASVPFDAPHQAGILTPAPAQATFAALDVIASDRLELREALRQLSARARQLTQGAVNPLLEIDEPPADSGVLGPVNTPDGLTVTVAFGASLFDERFGLAAQRPRGLTRMPNFPNDALDPERSHGDLLVQICANHRDTVVHTLRELLRPVRGALTLRWSIDGFSGAPRGPSPHSSTRNLFAFRDGTANPDTGDADLMRQLVWVGTGAGEPAWATGGTYQVLRAIRMHVEFWDRVGLGEQQEMIGRARDSGAPLGGVDEFQDPRFDLDPEGKRIPLDAHIRLANPRTPPTAEQRILRRGFNYHRGFDEADQLDQGLVFVAFNQDIERQFATIQRRLAQEPMVDYITPVGGGYFFAPPGSRSATDWVGSGLFV